MKMKNWTVFVCAFAVGAALGVARAQDDGHGPEHGGPDHGHGPHHGGKPVDLSKLPPASAQQGVTFEKDIKPIFEDACTRCHGEDKQKANLRLDTLAAVLKGGKDGKVVTPGNSAKSSLVVSVARLDPESAMPPDRKPGRDTGADGKKLPPVKHLSADQVGLIRAGIDQGAK